MSKANVGSILLAIYASKKIAECKRPELRYASAVSSDKIAATINGQTSHWIQRSVKVIKFVLSVISIKDMAIICTIAVTLVCRSLLRLKLRYISTSVENGVMTGSETSFWSSIKQFAYFIIPTSASYALFNYLLSELAINVRSNVSTRLLSKFASHKVYFQIINANQLQRFTPGSTQIEAFPNPDQVLTNDIEHFSYALSGLFSHVMRPVVDIAINAERLYRTGGAVIPVVMGIYLVVTSNILNYIRSPVTEFTNREQSLEGEYRSLIARIATSAEEIAALEGGRNEEHNVLQSMHPLLEYSRKFAQFRCNMSFIDAVVARYWLMMLGWRLVGIHFLRATEQTVSNHESLFRNYQNMSKTMLALSNGVGELIMSGRDVVKVYAYAEKLSQFEDALDELIRQNEVIEAQCTTTVRLTESPSFPELSPSNPQQPSVVTVGSDGHSSRGSESLCLALENVSIVPPSGGAPLHSGLNIIFRRNMHTVVTGENGAGKSSLLRVLAGIWPTAQGHVRRPLSTGLHRPGKCLLPVLYLPQSPYMTLGTLRQQMVYPEILAADTDFSELDAQLLGILSKVHLNHLMQPALCDDAEASSGSDVGGVASPLKPQHSRTATLHVRHKNRTFHSEERRRTGGYSLDSAVDWGEVLSGGEKQRLSLARLFYHQPAFALLDESTSAVSAEVEEELIRACVQELPGTTLITITHRPQLLKYHQYELRLMKDNQHTLTRLQPEIHN